MYLKYILLSIIVALNLSCAQTPSAERAPVQTGPRYLALEEYLPPAQWSTIVSLKPAQILTTPAWQPLVKSFMAASGLAAYQRVSNIDLKQVTEIWHASYALGSLTLIQPGKQQGALLDEIEGRALSSRNKPTSDPLTYRKSLRFATDQGSLVGLRDHFIGISLQDPSLARLALARAQGKMDHLPSALGTHELSTLTADSSSVPLRIFLKGPFNAASSPLLQELLAAMISVQLLGTQLNIEVRSLGAWQSDRALTLYFSEGLKALMQAPEIRALNLHRVTAPPQTDCRALELSTLCTTLLSYQTGDIAQALSGVLRDQSPLVLRPLAAAQIH